MNWAPAPIPNWRVTWRTSRKDDFLLRVLRHVKQKAKHHHGNQHQDDVEGHLPSQRRLALLPIHQLRALGDTDLLGMFQIPGELSGRLVAVHRLALQGAVNDLLKLWTDLRVDRPWRNGIVQQAVVHDGEWIRPPERYLPGQH